MAASCNAQRSTGEPWRARCPRTRLPSDSEMVMSRPQKRTAWRLLAKRRTSPNSAQIATAAWPTDPIAPLERLAAWLGSCDAAQLGVEGVEFDLEVVDHPQG